MAKGFSVNAHRYDPYKNYKFTVELLGRTVLGVSKVSALKRTTEVVKHRDGGDNSTDFKSPGRTTYEPLTMERGITFNAEFEKWANLVHPLAGDPTIDLKDYKQDLTLVLRNERGLPVKRYFLRRCWVSEYTAVPDLDANANAVAIESLKVELEGWERDPATVEVDENEPVPPA